MTKREQSEPKRKRGRPPKFAGVKRQNFSFRVTEEMRQRLIEEAKTTGRSLSEEIEFDLTSYYSWKATKRDIDKMLAEAAAARDAARVQAIREAGFQILRDVEGSPSRVIVSVEMLLGEADGIQRSGWGPPGQAEQPAPKQSRPATDDEIKAAIQEIAQMIAAARARAKHADDDAA